MNLAFTAVGDGPKSSVKTKRTKEDGEESCIYVLSFISV